MTPGDFLAAQPRPIRALAVRVRRVVRAALPTAEERVYPGWKALGYVHPEAGYVCGIFPRADHVALAFEFGAFLPDPHGLLRAGRTGSRRVRYVEIRRARDAPPRALRALLDAAVSFRTPPVTHAPRKRPRSSAQRAG